MKKRILSMLMVLALVLSMVPVFASAATETPQITQVSMTLNGILDVNFKVASNGADMSKCSVVITGAAAQTITSPTRDGDLYVYTAKVPAHKLPETMTVSLMLDGAAVQTQDWTAGPDYLSKLTGSNELTALASALQNYGTYAAAYAAGTVGEEIDGITAAELIDYKPVITVNGNLAAMASLYLDDAADLRVKFNEAAWVEGYQLKIDNEDATAVSDGNGKLVYTKEGLLPQDWSHMYDIKVVNGDTVVYQVSYSVNSYVYQALKRSEEAAAGLNNLLKSMYSYGTAANAYAPASKTAIALANLPLRDPFILNNGDAYYMYGTKDNGCFYVWSSTDLVNWYAEGKCYEIAAGDAYYDTTNSEIAFWAPEVYEYNGAYYMFATFTQAGTGNQQGTAVLKAESPVGPFEKWSDGFVTPSGHSCLDGTLYIENGVPYMIYAHEWQCSECGDSMGSMAYIQLTEDLKASTGDPVELFEAEDLTGYNSFQTTFLGKENAKVTDGAFVYTDANGQKYLLWSTSVDSGYIQAYIPFDSLSAGMDASESVKLYTADGGHGMIFTDMNGIDKLVLHTPNSSTSYPAIYNVALSNGTLGLENVNFISYIGVDGASNSNASSYSDGATTELAALTGRSNATFMGWYDADGNQVTSLAGKDGSLTLTAKWETADLSALNGAEGIYVLSDNVTCSETVASFAGTLDGTGKTISTTVPVFAAIGSGVQISNLTIDLTADLDAQAILCTGTLDGVTVTDVAILSSNGSALSNATASEGHIAAFAPVATGNSVFTNCSNAVDVTNLTSNAFAAGIISNVNASAMTFTNCSNSGDITASGSRGAAGIVAHKNNGTQTLTLTSCSNSGTITGAIGGGLLGRLDNGSVVVTNCASTGNVIVTNNGGSLIGGAINSSTLSFSGNTYGENTVTKSGIVFSAKYLIHCLSLPTESSGHVNWVYADDTVQKNVVTFGARGTYEYHSSFAQERATTYASYGTENTTLFIGDSFFDTAYWTNWESDLSGKDALVLGIGGTATIDWFDYIRNSYFLHNIAPKNLVVNLGNNDFYLDNLATTGEQYLANSETFYNLLHAKMPNTQIYVFSGIARTGSYANDTYAANMAEGNALLKTWCEGKDWITYIDLSSYSIDLKDNIHPANDEYNDTYLDALAKAGLVIEDKVEVVKYITSLSELEGGNGTYYLSANITDNTYTVSSFCGTLYGEGHTISTSVPLFAAASSASIENLTIDLTANLSAAGILCSGTFDTVTVQNVSVISSNGSSLSCASAQYVGGLVSIAKGNCVFTNCSNAVNVTNSISSADPYAAGIVGYVTNEMTFTSCVNSGNITCIGSMVNRSNAAGIVACKGGGTHTITLLHCENTGTITAAHGGGLLGRVDNASTAVVKYCAANGNVVFSNHGGSLVGYFPNSSVATLIGNTFGANNTITDKDGTYAVANVIHSRYSFTATSENEQVNTFVITYVLDGGSMSEATTVTVNQGGSISELPTPTRDGCNFLGWYDNGTEVTSLSEVILNYTLTAKWQEIKSVYTITYAGVDGATHANEASHEAGTEVTLTDASMDGYLFLGWYNEDGTQVTSVTVENDITLTAKWAEYIYDLYSLDGSSGAYALADDVENYDTVSSFSGTLYGCGHTISTDVPVFSALGSGAVIENLTIDLTENLDAAGILCTSALSGVTVKKVSILSSNGSAMSYASQQYIGAFAPQASNCVFTDCSNAVNVTNSVTGSDPYAAGIVGYVTSAMTFTNCVNSGNITCSGSNVGRSTAAGIVACKGGGTHTITLLYCENAGTITAAHGGGLLGRVDNASTAVVKYCAANGNVVLSNHGGSVVGYFPNSSVATLIGNTFGANNTITDKNGTYAAANVIHSRESFTATSDNEQVNTFVITYVLDGGSMSEATTVTVKQGAGISTLPTPTREGYNFLGWYNGSTEVTSLSGIKLNYTLTAHWQEIKDVYSVTYAGVDGATHTNAASYEDGTVVTLADATKDGSAFAGWFDEDGNYVETITVDGDITLTAKWGTGITALSEIDGQSGTYVLTADTTLSTTISSFSGTLYGKGHTVSTSVSVFASISSGAVIQDLNIDLTESIDATGILCSSASSVAGVTLTNVAIKSTNGSTFAPTNDSGTFMYKAGSGTVLTGCSNAVSITYTRNASGWSYIGGLVAVAEKGSAFTNCSNSGEISGTYTGRAFVGGIVSDSYYVTYTNCVNTGDIKSAFVSAGLVSIARGDTITGCINSAAINAADGACGIVGRLESGAIRVIKCQSLGNVTTNHATNGGSIFAAATGGVTSVTMIGNTFGDNTVTTGNGTYAAANALYPTTTDTTKLASDNEQTNNI